MITAVNPIMIEWARKRMGLSIEDLASKMKRDPEVLHDWESGDSAPSYTVLEDLAYKHLKVPLAVFFFPNPPDIVDPVGSFRRLPEYELERFSPDTIQKIRLAQAYQDSLEEIFQDSEPERSIHKDLSPFDIPLLKFSKKVRKYIGIKFSQQFSFRDPDQALKAWRHAIEEAGVFTFKDSFKDKFLSGFSLLHDDFPVIMLNNSNSFTRQIFSLIHELGHILYGVHGVTDIDEHYIGLMRSPQRRIEIQCNRFAAEVLVPIKRFEVDLSGFDYTDPGDIAELADKYSVSREVILRRLLDLDLVDNDFYSLFAEKWNQDFLRNKKESTGGDWYRTKLAYLGEGFVQSAFSNFSKGRFDQAALANHLNIKAQHLKKFESYLWR